MLYAQYLALIPQYKLYKYIIGPIITWYNCRKLRNLGPQRSTILMYGWRGRAALNNFGRVVKAVCVNKEEGKERAHQAKKEAVEEAENCSYGGKCFRLSESPQWQLEAYNKRRSQAGQNGIFLVLSTCGRTSERERGGGESYPYFKSDLTRWTWNCTKDGEAE